MICHIILYIGPAETQLKYKELLTEEYYCVI